MLSTRHVDMKKDNENFVVSRLQGQGWRADLKNKDHEFIVVFQVAGAGLEPATFGL